MFHSTLEETLFQELVRSLSGVYLGIFLYIL